MRRVVQEMGISGSDSEDDDDDDYPLIEQPPDQPGPLPPDEDLAHDDVEASKEGDSLPSGSGEEAVDAVDEAATEQVSENSRNHRCLSCFMTFNLIPSIRRH